MGRPTPCVRRAATTIRSVTLYTTLGISLLATRAFAQHEHHPAPQDSTPVHADTTGSVEHMPMGNMSGMEHMPMEHAMHDSTHVPHIPADTTPAASTQTRRKSSNTHRGMRHAMHDMSVMRNGPLDLPTERTGSGTSWLPDASPMYAAHRMLGAWTVMLHGEAFLQYDAQGSSRGGHQFGSINWGMLMASHDFGSATTPNATSRLTLRTMLSLDPATVTPHGYPLLLQSGESYRGVPLHDRQHPHDFFMEVAAMYDRQLTHTFGMQLYAAPVGEPAVGPVAFMHRPSAANDPFGPITHHWQDATHISFGVLTAGLYTTTIKLEGSLFNGREPDEHRWDFDFRRLDSYSGRLTVNPNARWSLQGSYAFLNSPEALEPDESVHRTTASAMYGRPFGTTGDWSTTFVYGANKHSGDHPLANSGLVETNLTLNTHNTVFARAEYVQKSAADLVIPPPSDDHFDVGAITLGYVRELATGPAGDLGLGARGTVNLIPTTLRPTYGTRTPLGLGVFLRYRPSGAHMSAAAGMHHPGMSPHGTTPSGNQGETPESDHQHMDGTRRL